MKKILRRSARIPENLSNSTVPPLLQRIYSARGINSPEDISYDLAKLLHFSSLKNIDQAVNILKDALEKQLKILIIGDFDADGATSTALAKLGLTALGFQNISYLIPNRFEFGYGLTPEIVAVAAKLAPDLIITVDNGVSSHAGVLAAKELGISVLVTDHHLPPAELPKSDAIVNPNQIGDTFPSKNLAGVGVVFYLLLALRNKLRQENWFQNQQIPEPNLGKFLDLVALGTIADVVSLDHNNRILVHQGLERIQKGECRLGIKALMNVSNRDYERTTSNDLGYAIAPRLNAAGRMDEMSLGVECLLTEDAFQAEQMAKALDKLNRDRREVEVDMQKQAMQILSFFKLSQDLPHGLCMFEPSWHLGVIGILASRIKEKVNRPVIAFARLNDDEIKGSGRSIPGLHLRDILSNISALYPNLISKFGGHAMAVGLSLRQENYEKFQEAFNTEVKKSLGNANLQSILHTDGELEHNEITLPTAQLLRKSGPWGQDFAEPLFEGLFKVIQQKLVGEKHLKLLLSPPGESNTTCSAIAFNIDPKRRPHERCNKVFIVYRLDVNTFNDRHYLQLIIEHLQEA